VEDALRAGRALCEADGSLARIAEVIRARDQASREFFDRAQDRVAPEPPSELPAYLTALGVLLPRRRLAVDAGAGTGPLLEVLAPVFDKVVAVDRAQAQLEQAQLRLDQHGYGNVELICAEYDGKEVRSRIDALGGADVVFASRVLHHAPRPVAALTSLVDLAGPGGAVLVIDYGVHEDERLRDQQADLWLGFQRAELLKMAISAGLSATNVVAVPALRCGDGPDGHLDWQVLVGYRSATANPSMNTN
jgi:ArsR family transcriptional regulator